MDAAWSTITRLQPSDFLAEMPAVQAIRLSFFRREPERMLDFARGLSEDYLDSHAISGPLGFFKGFARELAGREVQAEVEWRSALELTEGRLGKTPHDRLLLLWSAWLHAALNDTAGAERRFARSQALAGLQGGSLDTLNWRFLARLRKRDALLDGAEELLSAKSPRWEAAHAEMRFSPEFDFLRGDPRFEKLLRDNLSEGAKPLPELSASLQ